MTSYVMTSPNMAGDITITYNEAGLLQELRISDPLKLPQYTWLLNNIPPEYANWEAFRKRIANATFIKKTVEVTFQMFWDKYNDKDRSSKKRTEKLWVKLKPVDQVRAYLYIPKYERQRGSADKKYASTYLSDELWNN